MYIHTNPLLRCVAHQGYSITSEKEGNCRLSSYIAAARRGFDYGEADIKFTLDGIPVCSHDASFVDTKQGSNIINIAEHTLAELKELGYHGETIATLDEVVRTCKEQGLGLYIDHLYFVDTDDNEKWHYIFDIVTRYRMEDNVAWLIPDRARIEKVLAWYPCAEINLVNMKKDLSEMVELAAATKTCDNRVSINGYYPYFTIDQIIEYNRRMPLGVGLEFWTVDDVDAYRRLLPYVTALTSNKLSFSMLKKEDERD